MQVLDVSCIAYSCCSHIAEKNIRKEYINALFKDDFKLVKIQLKPNSYPFE